MGMGESGWEECVVVPVVPHSVAAILQMVGTPWLIVATPLQAVAALLRMVRMVAAPLQMEAAPCWMVMTPLQVGG